MKRVILGCVAALVVGCGEGPAPLTVVDELRILDVGVEPASPAAGESLALDVLVADPLGEGFEVWSWWCVDTTCSEGGALPEGQLLEVSALACAPGACDGPGELSDPNRWMTDLPIEGVSLVRRRVPMSPSPDARLNENPLLTATDLPETAGVGSTTELVFTVDDATVMDPAAYGYATTGGFRMAAGRPVIDGQVRLEFVAPEEPAEVELWVVLEDGLGGSAVWTGGIAVE